MNRKWIWALVLGVLALPIWFLVGQPTNPVTLANFTGARTLSIDTNGHTLNPTNFFESNLVAGANITLTPTNNGRLLIAGAAAGIVEGPVLYVSTNGNDATAVVGRRDLPWKTPSNAVYYVSANALDNHSIHFMPGTYPMHGRDVQPDAGPTGYELVLHGGVTNVDLRAPEGGVIFYTTNGGGCMSLSNVAGIGIYDIEFRGTREFTSSNPSTSLFAALYLQTNVFNLTVDHCKFIDWQDHSIVGSTSAPNGTNIAVTFCFFGNVGTETNGVIGGGNLDGTCIANLGAQLNISDNYAQNIHRFFEDEGNTIAYGRTTIMRNKIENCWNYGIMIFGGGSGDVDLYSEYLIADNEFFTTDPSRFNSDNQSITIQAGANIKIINNQFKDQPGYCIAAGMSGSDTLTNLTIAYNDFTRVGTTAIALPTSAGGGIFGVDISHNYFEWVTNYSIWMMAQGGRITGNRFRNCGWTGGTQYQIYLRKDAGISTNVVVDENMAQGVDSFLWVRDGSQDVSVHNNHLYNVTDATPVDLESASADVRAWENFDDGVEFFPQYSYQGNEFQGLVADTGTALTLALEDLAKTITLTNSSAILVTIPSGMVQGYYVNLVQLGAGTVTVTNASGVDLRSYGGLRDLGGQNAAASLIAIDDDTFILSGNLK